MYCHNLYLMTKTFTNISNWSMVLSLMKPKLLPSQVEDVYAYRLKVERPDLRQR